jgi:hypothetical protein
MVVRRGVHSGNLSENLQSGFELYHSQLTASILHCERETPFTFADCAAFHKFSVREFRLFLGWSRIAYDGDSELVCVGGSVQ